MEPPLVTVVIPAFNAEKYLDETLASIEAQTYPNIEVLVVDDGSTDATADIVRAHAPKIFYLHQENSGSCSSPRNLGLKHATGEFITFFDSDDIMLPHKIENQVEQFKNCPGAAFVTSNYRNFTDFEKSEDHFSSCPTIKSKLHESKLLLLGSIECRKILLNENFTIASSPLFRKEFILEELGFEESLHACEDFHLIYRIAMKGPIVILREIGFERRLHNLNMSGDPERMLSNFITSRQYLINLETNNVLRDNLKKIVKHITREYQSLLIRKGKLKKALLLYHQTFPPISRNDLRHDIRQGAKLALTYLGLREVEKN